MAPIAAPTDGPGANALANELDHLAQRVGRFLSRLKLDVDDAEVWLRRTDVRGYRIVGQEFMPTDQREELVGLRVFKDGKIGHAGTEKVDEAHWLALLKQALAGAQPSDGPPPEKPRPRRPGPMTFDSELADGLASGQTMRRVASALADNVWHEASRIPGLQRFEGEMDHLVRRFVVGNRQGVVASLHGALRARVELNGCYGDVFHQAHAPESFLPLALLGARTWRTMPRAHVAPKDLGVKDQMPVVLHPRLLEQLLRILAAPLLTYEAQSDGRLPFDEGELVTAPAVTLVDDPGLDGLAASRAFDDEGRPTRRTPLIVRGRLDNLLRGRRKGVRRHSLSSGGVWRLRQGRRGPHEAPGVVTFGSLLMERGDVGFHDMVAAVEKAILAHEVEDLQITDPRCGAFSARVRWGVTLERGGDSRLLERGAWQISGRLFGGQGGEGFLQDAVLSRELYDTGTAVLPYCLCMLRV